MIRAAANRPALVGWRRLKYPDARHAGPLRGVTQRQKSPQPLILPVSGAGVTAPRRERWRKKREQDFCPSSIASIRGKSGLSQNACAKQKHIDDTLYCPFEQGRCRKR